MSATATRSALLEHDPTLKIALVISVAVHAVLIVLLTIHFVVPKIFKLMRDPQIEIVLVNAKTETQPVKAEVMAQVSLAAGGDHDKGRATSPLPPQENDEEGDALKHSQKRVETLEEQQRRLMTQVHKQKQMVRDILDRKPDLHEPKPSGTDLMENSKAMARNFAAIDKNVEEYNKRPRKGVFGINAKGHSTALYVNAWQQKVERIGTQNYPDAARGKFYGQLILTVHINPDGSVADIDLDKSSGNEVLDRAAIRIVRRGEPYAKFTDEMRSEMDLLTLTRTWIFTNETLQTK